MKNNILKITALCLGFQVCAYAAEATETKGVTLFADYLYWYTSQQTDGVWANDIGFPGSNRVTYNTPNVKFNWSSGFRGGASYAIPGFWDVTFTWTYLSANKGMDYAAPAGHILTPEFFSGFLSGNTFSSASIDWKIVMNTFDLAISHAFYPTPSLIVRPVVGVKGASINQSLNSLWHATLFSVPIYTSTEYLTNNFAGVGPEFGVDLSWNIYSHFSLISDISTALMWGRWNVNDVYRRPSALSGLVTPATITTSSKNSKLGTPMFQGFFGVQWAQESTYQMKFLLGYEMQYWANQLRIPTFQLLPLHGDMTLQGVTCGLSIGF